MRIRVKKLMSDLIFVHRKDENNAGDLFSCPNLYFEFDANESYDIKFPETIPNYAKVCIIGGGGLGKPWFYERIEKLFQKKIDFFITWGIGYNHFEYNQPSPKKINDRIYDIFEHANIKSSRDYNYLFEDEWVPCVSCMNDIFDEYKNIKPTKEIGVIYHGATNIDINSVNKEDYLTNYGGSIEEKIKFISQYEYIISNSYHGIYWSVLLNKKVLILPWKSSLMYFKQMPRLYNNNLSLKENLRLAINYPNALQECRKANVSFYDKIINMIQ